MVNKIYIGKAGGDVIHVDARAVMRVNGFNNKISVLFKDGSPDCIRYGDELVMDQEHHAETGRLMTFDEQLNGLRHHIANAVDESYGTNPLQLCCPPKKVGHIKNIVHSTFHAAISLLPR